MNTGQFKRMEELFDAAVDLPPEQRHAFLQQACAGDVNLLRHVQRLLGFAERDIGVVGLDDASRDAAGTVIKREPGLTEAPGTQIGPYRIVRLIGEGGFGAVYEAEQEQPVRRRVALKIIKLGMDTRQVIARFEAERQALALMDHAGIARVFEAGATETGRPYFVMELVEGVAITEHCNRTHLSPRERLELFMLVCDAVQHAHQKGIIHRDLKPSNILVTDRDGEPIPKVIDFGIAKATRQRLTEKTLCTESGQLIGTPAYMSPEQAETGDTDIDTRSDIYSLGALLYELLTGTTPFDAQTFERLPYPEIQRIIREQDPPTPSTRVSGLGEDLVDVARERNLEAGSLPRLLRGDLDWIVMRSLDKDRDRRYPTTSELAADIGRYLHHEPVLAGPPGAAYRIRKFARRHRVAVFSAAGITLALTIGVAGVVWGLVRALRAERIARLMEIQTGALDIEPPKGITAFFDDPAGFEAAAGSPLSAIDFDGFPPGTEITGRTLSGVTFKMGDAPEVRPFPGRQAPRSAPLIVVRGTDTVTNAREFDSAPEVDLNKLFPTSGENVLSPGGPDLVAGPVYSRENDDLALIFDPPVTAVGFDILFQSLDALSYVFIHFFKADESDFEWGALRVPTSEEQFGGGPGGTVFVGFVCESPIRALLVNEADFTADFPDCNIGYDTIRVSRVPPATDEP
ncbi:MAG: serine/threonine protein kinase [Planctomycetota bacterium]|jgi:serine/threonine protein kinase